MNQGVRTIIAIDLLRFVCAAMVVAVHVCAAFAFEPPEFTGQLVSHLPIADASIQVCWAGWVGVELFFLISGYVITLSVTGTTPPGFLRRRMLRLAPAVWICASITAVLLAIAGPIDRQEVAAAWLRSVLFSPLGTTIDPSYWTLFIEIGFYLIVAAYLRRGGGRPAVERLAWVIGSASTAYWLVRRFAPEWTTQLFLYPWIDMLLLRHGVFFALGIQIAKAHDGRAVARDYLGAALFAVTAVAEIVDHAQMTAAELGMRLPPMMPVGIFFAGAAIVAAAHRLQGPLARILSPSLAARLGLATYPLYLLHQNLTAFVISHMPTNNYAWSAAIAIMLALAAAFAVLPLERRLRGALARLLDEATEYLSQRRSLAGTTHPAYAQRSPCPSARYSADCISISRETVRSNSNAPSPAG